MSHGGKRAGAGRPKGSLGEQTKSIKEAIEYAFYKIGGPKALAEWAQKNQDNSFKSGLMRLIPKDINASVSPSAGVN
jgi:hypothetical protein